jgi:hypothetical protein
MSLDYQQVQKQIKELGDNASQIEQRRKKIRELGRGLMESYSEDLEKMRAKVSSVAKVYDPNLRCALPVSEALNRSFPQPALQLGTTLLAADGSQIAYDRHAEVSYCLINVGAIKMRTGSPKPPVLRVESKLIFEDVLYTDSGAMSEAALALTRDLEERALLARLALGEPGPVVSFTDGPMELWEPRDAASLTDYHEKLNQYLEALDELCQSGAVTAGYVDKPASSLVVRLLEIMLTPEDELPEIKNRRPLRGLSDRELYREILEPGERSAVFAIQSKSAALYKGQLALHFFYLNVGREGRPWLARVETPAWVALDPLKLDALHAALVSQCRVLGSRAYPYLLHRAHEAAVVTYEEKEHVTQMIIMELRQRGLEVGELSAKQYAKNLAGKTRYQG